MINASIIADSVASTGKRITTFELEYPRFIHSEFMTHRMISRNAASSRAIPIESIIKLVMDSPAMPVHWGKNQSGMSAKEELNDHEIAESKKVWLTARDNACASASELVKLGLHKQIANRILEPWLHIKTVATATEWDNFFHLRCHPDAQPEIKILAEMMRNKLVRSSPEHLYSDQYHLPYVTKQDLKKYSTENCIKLSASLCAQVSYRKGDESLEKALLIYERLVGGEVKHASPFEHQATPSIFDNEKSGNFTGWIQYRQQLFGHECPS